MVQVRRCGGLGRGSRGVVAQDQISEFARGFFESAEPAPLQLAATAVWRAGEPRDFSWRDTRRSTARCGRSVRLLRLAQWPCTDCTAKPRSRQAPGIPPLEPAARSSEPSAAPKRRASHEPLGQGLSTPLLNRVRTLAHVLGHFPGCSADPGRDGIFADAKVRRDFGILEPARTQRQHPAIVCAESPTGSRARCLATGRRSRAVRGPGAESGTCSACSSAELRSDGSLALFLRGPRSASHRTARRPVDREAMPAAPRLMAGSS